jgi:outer membrane protein assembly factor BamA
MMVASLLGALCARGSAHAEIPDALRGQAIIGIRVSGDGAREAGPELTGIALGEHLGRSLVRRAVEKLLADGRWVDVQVDAEPSASGVVLVFYLEPRIRVHRVDVHGPSALDSQVVRDALGVAAGAEVREDALPTLESNVRRAYAERGYLGVRVTLRLRDTDLPSDKVLIATVDEGQPTRLTALRCRGATVEDEAALFSAMGLNRGDVLDRRSLSSAVTSGERFLRSKLYLEARLQSPVITVRGNSASLTFPLHLGPRYTLEVRGATPLRETEIASTVLLVDAPLTTEVIDAMPARVKDLYAKSGFLHARVSVRRKLVAKDRALLLAQIEPGSQIAVTRVRFPGAQHFTPAFLLEQLASYLEETLPGGSLLGAVDSEVAAEITHGTVPGRSREVPPPKDQEPLRTYHEATYREAVKHITEMYQAAGFLSVQVGAPALHMLDAKRASVAIRVVEGPRTLLHSVVLYGEEAVSSQELLLTAGLLRGAPFSYFALEEARVRLLELYQERGHTFARVEPSVRFSSDRTRAEVSIQIVEGFEVRVGDILVQGAERVDVGFVRSLVSLKTGDVFRPSEAHASERTLSTLGVIGGVSVQLEDPDLPARVKRLLVIVTERTNQFLDFGAALSTGQGASAGFDYGYRNLFGYAVGLSLRVQFSYQLLFVEPAIRKRFDQLPFQERLERNIALGLVIPRSPGLGATRVNLDLVHLRDNERDFGLDKNGVTLAFTETPWRRVTLREAGDLENNNIDIFESKNIDQLLAKNADPRIARLLRVPGGNTTLVTLRLSLSYDQRDSPFVPTRGFLVSLSSELSSTLRTENSEFRSRFLKLEVTANGYLPVSRSIVLAGQVRVGRIAHLTGNSQTYPNHAFFLGGVETLRGYYQDELIPQDATELAKNPDARKSLVRSGDAFTLVRAELRFPIYGQLGGGLFADLGNLWRTAAKMNPLDLRPTAGVGLRLSSPVGPIAVDYGIVLLRRAELAEPFGTLQFSIGLF